VEHVGPRGVLLDQEEKRTAAVLGARPAALVNDGGDLHGEPVGIAAGGDQPSG
jgi:hypothetical protein